MRTISAVRTRLRGNGGDPNGDETTADEHQAGNGDGTTRTEDPPAPSPMDPLLADPPASGRGQELLTEPPASVADAAVVEAPPAVADPVTLPHEPITEEGDPAGPVVGPLGPLGALGLRRRPRPPRTPRPPRQRVRPALPILRRRPRVRKVTRIVRRVDAWGVFKISIIFYVILYIILLVAGILLWNLANTTGTVANVEGFARDLFGLKTFEFDGEKLFRASWVLGAILVVAGTGLNVTLAVLFNLISDLVGGVRRPGVGAGPARLPAAPARSG